MQSTSIHLVGLPGCGKSRLGKVLLDYQSEAEQTYQVSEAPLALESDSKADTKADLVLCVIDIRSTLQAGRDDWLEAELIALLKHVHAVVFNFVEASALDEQAWWGRWIKSQKNDLTVLRLLNGRLPSNWQTLVESTQQIKPITLSALPESAMQTFEFKVGRICLDHLLLGFDSSKQNLGMKVARVFGMVDTLEYENRVVIEGSALRWDMFAADDEMVQETDLGLITVQGQDLERAWLEELIKASLV